VVLVLVMACPCPGWEPGPRPHVGHMARGLAALVLGQASAPRGAAAGLPFSQG